MKLNLKQPIAALSIFISLVFVYMFFLGPWGHDIWIHIFRYQDIKDMFDKGGWLFHFSQNAADGKLLPIYIYYSQWVYWLPIVTGKLGIGSIASFKLSFLLFFLIATSGCYLFLRLHVQHSVAAFGTLLFVTSNYVLGDIFVRAAYAEFLSYALLPFLLYALNKYFLNRNTLNAVQFMILAGVMILFHPISFMNTSILLILYALYISLQNELRASYVLLNLALLITAALSLSGFFWIPALVEKKYILGISGLSTNPLDTLLSVGSYLDPNNYRIPGPILSVLLIISITVFSYKTFRNKKKIQRSVWILVFTACLYFFLTTTASFQLWKNLPLFDSNIFLWRLMYPFTLVSVLIVVTFLQSSIIYSNLRIFTSIVSWLLIAQGITFIFLNSYTKLRIYELKGIKEEQIRYTIEMYNQIRYRWGLSERLPNLTFESYNKLVKEIEEESIIEKYSKKNHGWGINEYLPDPAMFESPPAFCGNRTIDIDLDIVRSRDSTEFDFLVPVNGGTNCFHLPIYSNIRYTAEINGERTNIYSDKNGEIIIYPNGKSGIVTVKTGQPSYVRISEFCSILSLFAVTLIIIINTFPRIRYGKLNSCCN